MSGSHLCTKSVMLDNVGWQSQIQNLNLSGSSSVFSFIFLHKKASVDLRLIIDTQLLNRLPPTCFCVINVCNQRFSTSFGDQKRNGSVYSRPQPFEELQFSDLIRQESCSDVLPVLRKISAKEEALVIQLDLAQIFT